MHSSFHLLLHDLQLCYELLPLLYQIIFGCTGSAGQLAALSMREKEGEEEGRAKGDNGRRKKKGKESVRGEGGERDGGLTS